MENNGMDLHTEFLADVAEFWVHNREFRDAVNQVGTDDENAVLKAYELRAEIFRILNGPNGDPAERVKKSLGQIINLPTKSPIRKRVLTLLESFLQDPKYQKEKNPVTRIEDVLTAEEQKIKTTAKGLYNAGHYREALEMVLPLLKSPRIMRNVGMVGFIMNCYNKLGYYENALKYAKFYLALKTDVRAFGIAALAAQRLEQWGEALQYAKEYLKFKVDPTALGIAALAAKKLGQFEEALSYARRITELENDNEGMIGMVAQLAHRLMSWEEALRYAEKYLTLKVDSAHLWIAADSAYQLGKDEQASMYANRILEKVPDDKRALRLIYLANQRRSENIEIE